MPLPQNGGAGPSLGPPPAIQPLPSAQPPRGTNRKLLAGPQGPWGTVQSQGEEEEGDISALGGLFQLFLQCMATVPALKACLCCVSEGGVYKSV